MTYWLGVVGAYFFLALALLAAWMSHKKTEPKRAIAAIGLGSVMLSSTLFLSAFGDGWPAEGPLHFVVPIACVFFFGGMIGWGFYHRSKSR